MKLKPFLLNRTQLLKIPELDLPQEAIESFDRFYTTLLTEGNATYSKEYPLYQFLNYLIEHKNILVHGSNHPSIHTFEPKESALFNNKPIKAVFASSDGVWSLFFAVLDKKTSHSIRNLCLTSQTRKGIKRYYYFSINEHMNENRWTNGTIYFFPKNRFKQGGIENEWVCETEVEPLAKLEVKPEDFPFLDNVMRHSDKESVIATIVKGFVKKK
ncbi:hypothetical protein [Alteribacter aurantiacus]|uniref:hypothetical protein n=1 Tax=Alteribacter aurantiacus TaxID=254410 RepID=UPI0004245BEF|nr:hypothetical protein [Alteribacter aurantiacus]